MELVGGFPSLQDLLYVAVDRVSVSLGALDEVDGRHYRLAGRHSTMDLFDAGLVTQRLAVRVMTGQVDEEVGVVPFLHARSPARRSSIVNIHKLIMFHTLSLIEP